MRSAIALLMVVSALCLTASTARAEGVINFINIGCDSVYTHTRGCGVTSVKGPVAPGDLARGSKTGEACGWNVLFLFAWGDLRIETAMKNGNIEEVSSIDYSAFQLLPFVYGISRYCTVVSGN